MGGPMPEKSKTRRIALISDVHGNLPALEAVLEDARRGDAEEIWNLGDILGYAPFPNDVVEKLREVNATNVIGNYDVKVLTFERKRDRWKHTKMPEKYAAFQWNHEHLSRRARAFLKSLPGQVRVQINGSTALLVHGSPAAIDEPLGSETSEQRFAELAGMAAADVVLCGHSHEAFVRRVGETWFVNPGSAGRPEGGDWRASYALLEFAADGLKAGHRRVEYDVDRVARAVHAAGLPESFVDVFRTAQSLDQLRREEPTPGTGRAMDAVLTMARSCRYEQEHAHQVTRLAVELFDQLKELHGMGPPERLWLQYGALLHDIGWIEGQQAHHKRALDLIIADPRLPFERRERTIVGLIARYHRGALPDPGHKYFAGLDAADQRRVCVLAGILRVADGLDRGHLNRIQTVRCEVSKHRIVVLCEADESAEEEISAAAKKADLLESIYGLGCEVKVRVKASRR
jgi:putative phosphoesterase